MLRILIYLPDLKLNPKTQRIPTSLPDPSTICRLVQLALVFCLGHQSPLRPVRHLLQQWARLYVTTSTLCSKKREYASFSPKASSNSALPSLQRHYESPYLRFPRPRGTLRPLIKCRRHCFFALVTVGLGYHPGLSGQGGQCKRVQGRTKGESMCFDSNWLCYMVRTTCAASVASTTARALVFASSLRPSSRLVFHRALCLYYTTHGIQVVHVFPCSSCLLIMHKNHVLATLIIIILIRCRSSPSDVRLLFRFEHSHSRDLASDPL